MKGIQLDRMGLINVAELIEKTNLEELSFTPGEIKLLFKLDNYPKDLKDFTWNIRAGFIKGKVFDEVRIFPPRLLMTEHIDTYYGHPLAMVASSLSFMNEALTSPVLLEKIKFHLYEEFDYLSLGQAKSIIKRKLKVKLNSAERNDLSRLRKKFNGYRRLIDAFADMVDKKTGKKPSHSPPLIGSTENYLSSVGYKLHFMCMECKTCIEFPDSDEPLIPPIHHGVPMVLNWGSVLSSDGDAAKFQKPTKKKQRSGADKTTVITKSELKKTQDELDEYIYDLKRMSSKE